MKDALDRPAVRPGMKQRPELRLFCFPYAGGSGHVFMRWGNSLPEGIEVCPVELPGHGTRMTEPLFNHLTPLVDSTFREIVRYTDAPFAFFGHSMGALMSFELARRFRREERHGPLCLFVSGNRAPQIPLEGPKLHELPFPAFADGLRRLNGTPREVLENVELMELLLPILRADFSVCETYEYQPEGPLDCPITAFGGSEDLDVTTAHLQAWGEMTRGAFALHILHGDHFFMHKTQSQLLSILQLELRKFTGQAAWKQ